VLVPEDIPADRRDNALWFEVIKVPRVTVPAVGPIATPEFLRAFARFASRHAPVLAHPPAGLSLETWLGELGLLLQQTGRTPSRATNPVRLVTSVDVEALRRRPQAPREPFIHPDDVVPPSPFYDPGLAEDEAPPPPEPWVCPAGQGPRPDRPPSRPVPPRRRHFPPWSADGVEVRQLTSLADLRAEGAAMHNCVADYDDEVRAGSTAIFSVRVEAKRFTLALVRRGAAWHLSEFKGIANRQVTAEERTAIEPWLRSVEVEEW
jgi:hypothetical protein